MFNSSTLEVLDEQALELLHVIPCYNIKLVSTIFYYKLVMVLDMILNINIAWEKVLYHLRSVISIISNWTSPHKGSLLFRISEADSAEYCMIRYLGERQYDKKYCQDIALLRKFRVCTVCRKNI